MFATARRFLDARAYIPRLHSTVCTSHSIYSRKPFSRTSLSPVPLKTSNLFALAKQPRISPTIIPIFKPRHCELEAGQSKQMPPKRAPGTKRGYSRTRERRPRDFRLDTVNGFGCSYQRCQSRPVIVRLRHLHDCDQFFKENFFPNRTIWRPGDPAGAMHPQSNTPNKSRRFEQCQSWGLAKAPFSIMASPYNWPPPTITFHLRMSGFITRSCSRTRKRGANHG